VTAPVFAQTFSPSEPIFITQDGSPFTSSGVFSQTTWRSVSDLMSVIAKINRNDTKQWQKGKAIQRYDFSLPKIRFMEFFRKCSGRQQTPPFSERIEYIPVKKRNGFNMLRS
jgi:hypothetical protein